MYYILVLSMLAVVSCQKPEPKLKDLSSLDDGEPDIADIFNVNATKIGNDTKMPLGTERIVQPSQPQAVATQNVLNSTTFKPPPTVKDFKPSPQLETYYEYNKKPVIPAYGEAKSFPDYNFGVSARIPNAPWLKIRHYFNPESSEEPEVEQQEDTKIRFPTPTPSTLPKIHPYPYVQPMEPISSIGPPGQRKPDVVEDITHKTVAGNSILVHDHIGSTSKPVQSEEYYEPASLNQGLGGVSPPFYAHAPGEGFVRPSFSYTFPTGLSQDTAFKKPSYESHLYGNPSYEKPLHDKPLHDKPLYDKPVHEKPFYEKLLYDKPFYEKPSHDRPLYERPKHDGPKSGLALSPWKKIIKFLTAIIPFGLLISALTPTVIDVSPMANQTALINGVTAFNSGRARYDGNIRKTSLELLNSLSKEGCEERVLCELLLNAGSSQNAQQHIENLLDTFMGDGRDSEEQKAELGRIFKAVKNENCKSLACEQIKEISQESDED